MTKVLMVAYNSLQQGVEQYIEKLNPRPSCIVSDTFLLWPRETAKKFQIPRIVFDGMSCFTQMCNHVLYLSKGVAINSFEEMEKEYADEYRKIKGDKVWCIGPLSLCHKDESEKFQRGNKSSINKNKCLEWLDSQENGSVIYACLGSISRVEPTQLIELALALESSKKPFIWVVRADHKTENIENWIDEEGFEERTNNRSALLIRGWAPQILVLSHPAIGGFLTHCGWNSILEGICAGVPMVTWPQFQDQFYNEKLVVQVLRIGVSVGAQNGVNSVLFGNEEKSGVVKH
nr:putative UDP-glucuronosyl/UDP-glucosyltransferase [Tanacetum cinerariifolium]